MSNIAFLVEGTMEQKIIQSLCPGKPVRLIGCNGDSVTIETLVKFIDAKVNLLKDKYYPIIIWFDREGREEDCQKIEELVLDQLEKIGHNKKLFRIGIPDRCTETWILAGDPDISEYEDKKVPRLPPNEGQKSKGMIKRSLGLETYVETLDGVSLFLNGCPVKMANRSDSFQRFKNKLMDLNCDWINKLV